MKYSLGHKSILFKYISINLKNTYLSTIKVSNEYTLDLAKNIYNYLKTYYPLQVIENAQKELVTDVEDIAEYFLFGHDKEDFSSNDIGAIIKEKINDSDDANSSDIYDMNSRTYPENINDINIYNIDDWPINDSIIQYLQPGVVISESSTVDEIAVAQYQLTYAGYKIPKITKDIDAIGEIDNNFKLYCYAIQKSEFEKNYDIVKTGYYDIFVESYARGLSEVRS